MTTSEQMRRLEALERAASAKHMEETWERDAEAMRARAAELAVEFDVPVDKVLDNVRESMRRLAEVGEEQWYAEMAAEFGTTVEELKSGAFSARMDREWVEWQGQDRARRAEVVYWRGGNPPIPYRNGQPVTDGSAGTWR